MTEQIASDLVTKLAGVTVALTTPLDKDGKLDVEALERLVERTIANGAACLFPLGWAGEEPLLENDVREQMIRRTCRSAAGRLPVMAGVSEQSLPRTLRLARIAADAGADLILATPPYSYPIPQKHVLQYFAELAREANMPLVVYQNDEVSVRVEVDTIVQLSETPGVIGIKTFMPYLEMQSAFLRADRPGRFAVISGNEYLYGAGLALGIRHFTMGGPGNLNLRCSVAMYRAAQEGRWDFVWQKQKRLIEFCDAVYLNVDSPYSAVKYAMSRLGVCSAHVVSPLVELPDDQKRVVDSALEQFADIVDSDDENS